MYTMYSSTFLRCLVMTLVISCSRGRTLTQPQAEKNYEDHPMNDIPIDEVSRLETNESHTTSKGLDHEQKSPSNDHSHVDLPSISSDFLDNQVVENEVNKYSTIPSSEESTMAPKVNITEKPFEHQKSDPQLYSLGRMIAILFLLVVLCMLLMCCIEWDSDITDKGTKDDVAYYNGPSPCPCCPFPALSRSSPSPNLKIESTGDVSTITQVQGKTSNHDPSVDVVPGDTPTVPSQNQESAPVEQATIEQQPRSPAT